MTDEPKAWSELLLCPFCGGAAETFGEDSSYFAICRTYCKLCHVGTPNFSTRGESVVFWNTRADSAQEESQAEFDRAGQNYMRATRAENQLMEAKEEIERLESWIADRILMTPEEIHAMSQKWERADHDSMTQTRRAIGLEEELILVRGDMSRALSSAERAEARVSDMETDLRLIRKSITIEQVRSVFVGRDAILAARKSAPAKAEEESK